MTKKYYSIFLWFIFLIYMLLFVVSYYFEAMLVASIVIEYILLAVMIFLQYKIDKNFSNPLFWWMGFWLGAIPIARIDLKLYEFNSTWGEDLLYVVASNTVLFFLVYQFSNKIKLKLSPKKVGIKQKIELSTIITVVLVISNIAFIINSIWCGNIPQLSSNVDVTRRTFVNTPWFSIMNVTRFVYSILPIYLSVSKNKNNKYKTIILALINCIFTFLTGWRTYLFQIIVLFVTSQFVLFSNTINQKATDYETKLFKNKMKKRLKKFIWIIVIFAIVLILVVGVTRGGNIKPQEYFAFLLRTIYLYIAPNFLNFQTAMETLTPVGSLMYSTEGIWGVFISSSNIPGFQNLSFNIGAFNVSTYLLQPYADMGMFGTCLWTSIIAFVSGFVYKNMNRKREFFNYTLLGIMNLTIFNMHNGFFLRSSSVLIWMLCAVIVDKVSVTSIKSGEA